MSKPLEFAFIFCLLFQGVELHFKAFTRKDRVETLKHAIDKYFWFLGKQVGPSSFVFLFIYSLYTFCFQATAAVISHKFKGWVSDKRQMLHLGSKRGEKHSQTEDQETGSRTSKPGPPLGDIL